MPDVLSGTPSRILAYHDPRMAGGSFISRLVSGLTERRLRVHGLILATCLWSSYVIDLAHPGVLDRFGLTKGADFVHFYTLGTLALEGRASELYNSGAQATLAAQLVPGVPVLYYVALYGPQVSLFFAPFAKLPYVWALCLWWLFSAAIYGGCCYAVWRTCPRLRTHSGTVFILAIAYPAFFHLIAWGQTSAPALLFFTLAYLALRADREFLAGLAIGLLIYKPQLGIAGAILFLFSKQWRLVAGAVISGAAELSVGWLYYGTAVMREYWNVLRHFQQVLPNLEPRPYVVHCLRAFWAMLVPVPIFAALLYILSAVIVISASVLIWRSRAPLALRYSALLMATVLVAPHLTIYDLVILAPAFLLLADLALQERAPTSVPILLYLCYALPLIGPF